MEEIVSFNEICKSYGKFKVLDNLSFHIEQGIYIALIGSNGCGKTTTINIMSNLTPYNSGEVLMFGKQVNRKYVSYKNRLGIVLSEPYYIEEFTPNEYLKFVCKFQFVPKQEIQKRIDDIVNFLEIDDYKKKKIQEYSSGNQMKISLCAALIHNPELLVLDEPFINLDIHTTQTIISLLKSFRGKKTLFISSHDLDLVANLCDRFLIMEEGKIAVDIYRTDYSNIDDIKVYIKELLVKKGKINSNLRWLK